jgi:hypothetical protein
MNDESPKDVEIMEKIALAESARQTGNDSTAIQLLIETLRAIIAKETKNETT